MMKQITQVLALGSLAVAVGACSSGGDSSGGGSSVTVDASPIKVFSDGSGVGKVRTASGGEVSTGYILTPELTLALQEFEATQEITPFDITSLPLTGSGPNTQIREGAVTVDGVTINVTAAITNAEDAGLSLLEEPSSGLSILISEGVEATGLPSSGTATYSGLFGMQDVYYDPSPELGTFMATADFQNSNVTLDGSTASYRASGTATISGNSFSSGSITIEDQPFAIVESGSLQGDFHGDGGNSMAGVIYSNDSSATYRGGFVGSQ